MTAPKTQPDPERPRVLRLPDLDDRRIPGWSLTRHAVGWTLAIFAAILITALIGAAVITMRVTVPGEGVLEPMTVLAARPLEGGIISAVTVRTGDTVVAGQVVARLDSTILTSDVADLSAQVRRARIELERLLQSAPIEAERARAAVAAAEANVIGSRTILRQRMAEFSVTGSPDSIARSLDRRIHLGLDQPSAALLGAFSNLQDAQARLSAAALSSVDVAQRRAEVDRLEELLASRRARLARHEIRSPATGVVLTDQLEQLPGTSVVPGAAVLEIADVQRWRATLSVKERDVHRVRVGDTVDVEVPAFAALEVNRFRGRVSSVGWQPAGASAATGAPATAGYRVVVEIDARDLQPFTSGSLRRGYGVHGEIVTRSERALALLVESFRDRARAIAR